MVQPMPEEQLPLALRLKTAPSFANFVVGANREAVDRARALAEGSVVGSLLLWGAATSGKTHLLESAVRAALLRGRAVRYLSLREHEALSPTLLDDLEHHCELLCLDDVDAVAGKRLWEEALFRMHLRSETCPWLCAARQPPAAAGFVMPELASRLAAALVYQIPPLDDAGKRVLIGARSAQLGLELDPAVAGYLLERHARDLRGLMALLDRIDRESLRSQRRPSLAFVRRLVR